ncbi:hypothetical protein V1499_09840 [Neobacillus sp. SCS-31]|uniref:hypothetical protein n=1 Tax=Neobacillus oceani TaxID=3115292 RepID=UPI003906B13A
MMLEEKHLCENCNKEFEWYYIVPQHMSSGHFKTHVIPRNKSEVKHVNAHINKVPTNVTVHCSNCDHLNTFDVDVKNGTV